MGYIVNISGSDFDTICVFRFDGTEEQVRRYLHDLVQSDRAVDPDGWDCGTENPDDVYKEGDNFYAYATYADYHINYQAVPEEAIQLVKGENNG